MRTKDVKNFIARAIEKYAEYLSIKDTLKTEAMKHIDWVTSVYVTLDPEDMDIYVSADIGEFTYMVPAGLFFETAKKKEDMKISIEEFKELSIFNY